MSIVRAVKAQSILFASMPCEQPLLLNCAHFVGIPPVMTESKFNELIDQTFTALELALDEVDEDLD